MLKLTMAIGRIHDTHCRWITVLWDAHTDIPRQTDTNSRKPLTALSCRSVVIMCVL